MLCVFCVFCVCFVRASVRMCGCACVGSACSMLSSARAQNHNQNTQSTQRTYTNTQTHKHKHTSFDTTTTEAGSTVPGFWSLSLCSVTLPAPSTTTVHGWSPMAWAPKPTPNHSTVWVWMFFFCGFARFYFDFLCSECALRALRHLCALRACVA